MMKRYVIMKMNHPMEAYQYADKVSVTRNGDLLFLDQHNNIIASIARGFWSELREGDDLWPKS